MKGLLLHDKRSPFVRQKEPYRAAKEVVSRDDAIAFAAERHRRARALPLER